MQRSLSQQFSLSLSPMWPGLGFVCSEQHDDYRSFEPTTALCGGKPGI